MNSGSFFRLDLDSSKVVDGITVFDYIDFPDLSAGDEGLRYPIRLSITQDAVSFFVHYFQKQAVPRHSEEVILHLPYNSKDTEKLSSTIKHIYNTDFPQSDYIYKCINKRYLDDKEKRYDDKDKKYKEYRNCQIINDSYSSLAIWGLVEEYDNKRSYNLLDGRLKQSETDSERITKFLRKLLLDFMFDMMHSDVFECSKYYAKMEEGLMNDFFFSSIVKKTEYYYNRHLVRSRFAVIQDDNHYILSSGQKRERILSKEKQKKEHLIKRIGGLDRAIEKREKKLPPPSRRNPICPSIREIIYNRLIKKKEKLEDKHKTVNERISNHNSTNKSWESTVSSIIHLYAEKLDLAEKGWVDVIMSPLADKHFTFSPEWFKCSSKHKNKESVFDISEAWFVSPEKEMERVIFPYKDVKYDENHQMHYLNSYELGDLMGTCDNYSASTRNSYISKWFYRRYNFSDAFRMHLFQGWNPIFFGLLWIFSAVFIFSYYWTDFWLCSRNIALLPAAASIACFLSAIWYWIHNFKFNSNKIDNILIYCRRKRERFRAFRLSLFFLLFWLFLFLFNYETNPSCPVFVKAMVLILVPIPLVWNKLHMNKVKIWIENIHLLLPKLVASITAAWIMLVIGNELFKEHLSAPLCVIVTIIVFTYILYENDRTLPNLEIKEKIRRTIRLMVISYFFSIVIGIFAIDIVRNSHEQVPYVWHFLQDCDKLSLAIFPKYLIRFSFLAMFIGVFIQMIFEEKNITEM